MMLQNYIVQGNYFVKNELIPGFCSLILTASAFLLDHVSIFHLLSMGESLVDSCPFDQASQYLHMEISFLSFFFYI